MDIIINDKVYNFNIEVLVKNSDYCKNQLSGSFKDKTINIYMDIDSDIIYDALNLFNTNDYNLELEILIKYYHIYDYLISPYKQKIYDSIENYLKHLMSFQQETINEYEIKDNKIHLKDDKIYIKEDIENNMDIVNFIHEPGKITIDIPQNIVINTTTNMCATLCGNPNIKLSHEIVEKYNLYEKFHKNIPTINKIKDPKYNLFNTVEKIHTVLTNNKNIISFHHELELLIGNYLLDIDNKYYGTDISDYVLEFIFTHNLQNIVITKLAKLSINLRKQPDILNKYNLPSLEKIRLKLNSDIIPEIVFLDCENPEPIYKEYLKLLKVFHILY